MKRRRAMPAPWDSRIGERDVLANGPVEEHVLFKTTPISRRSQVGLTTGTSTPSTSFTGRLASTHHRPAPQGLGKMSLDGRKSQFLSTPRRQTGILMNIDLVPSGEC